MVKAESIISLTMADEYNSKLIAKLYEDVSRDENLRILEEMEEIGSSVFIYPIFSAWRKHNSRQIEFISHYFISSLSRIQSGEVLKVGIQIWKEASSKKDKIWCYGIFTKFNYSDEEIIKYAERVIIDFADSVSISNTLSDYDIEELCNYLIKVDRLKDISESLRKIVIKDTIEFGVRKVSLRYLWKSNPVPEIKYFIDNYLELKNDELDVILAKTLISWKGKSIEELKQLVKENGNDRAREILATEEKNKEKEDKKEKEKENKRYGNIKTITDISKLRNNINSISLSNIKVGFKLFNDNELLIEQQETVSSNDSLVSKCMSLRTLFTDINSHTKQHGLSTEEVAKLLSQIKEDDFLKPINSLYIFLYNLGLSVKFDVFGMRNVNQIVSLFGHPDQKKELVKILKENNLNEYYLKEDWQSLHSGILELYRLCLLKLYEEFSKSELIKKQT